MRATWLADVLRAAGLDVLEEDDWQGRGRDGRLYQLDAQVIVCHHTGSAPTAGEFPSRRQIAYSGNPGVPAPLAQLILGRGTGRWLVVASGVSNNAGRGGWAGYKGNRRTIGIEAEHSGGPNEPWPPVVYDSYARGVSALADQLGLETGRVCGHKEWAPGRKHDPTFDMDQFRTAVDYWRLGVSPVPPQRSEEESMPLPCMHPAYKAGPQKAAGNRTAFYSTDGGSLLLGWNGAAIAGDKAYPISEEVRRANGGISDDEASIRGLTFRYLQVPVAPGQHLQGVGYYVPAAGKYDVAQITAYASDGATFTYPAS